ncbi:MAG: Cof-type HAD-IIB family hydrolase [Sphaerochaetaceae bacterium]|nr:Cof-type HAD-IIB family hydrolase [Sphaerochaetaceae bacterium]
MRPHQIKLICIDVDNTLVDDRKNIPEPNRDAIRWAHFERGAHIAINSGRIAPSTRDYMERLGVHDAYPSLNGCVVQSWDGSFIEENSIDRDVALEINTMARSLGCTMFVYHHDLWYLDPGNDYWAESEFKATGIRGTITDTDTLIRGTVPNKMLGVQVDPCATDILKKRITEAFPDYVDCFKSDPRFLEIVPKGVNKGTAVQALCRHYGIAKENVMAIGDYYNDIDMFRESAVSVAMANAPDDIKGQVTYVTEADNLSCGVAEAIYRFLS